MRPGALQLSARRDRGFTLIEVMAVLVVLALVAGLVLPALRRSGRDDVGNDAKELAAAVEVARRGALTSRSAHRVVLDLENASWWIERAEVRAAAEPSAVPSGLPGEPPLWGDADTLPMSAPPAPETTFVPLVGLIGRGNTLRPSVSFEGAQTDDGWIEMGHVHVELHPDGSADRTLILLTSDDGARLQLTVEALDERVGILHDPA